MLRGKLFQLKSATLAIETVNGSRTAVTLPKGATIHVQRGPVPDDTRMVDIEWDGRQLVMFLIDLQERGEELGRAAG